MNGQMMGRYVTRDMVRAPNSEKAGRTHPGGLEAYAKPDMNPFLDKGQSTGPTTLLGLVPCTRHHWGLLPQFPHLP